MLWPSKDSSIVEIETYIAQTIIQMNRINKPRSISGNIQLGNSMISGTAYFEKLLQFKISYINIVRKVMGQIIL